MTALSHTCVFKQVIRLRYGVAEKIDEGLPTLGSPDAASTVEKAEVHRDLFCHSIEVYVMELLIWLGCRG